YNNVAIRYTFPFVNFNIIDQPDDLTLYSAPIDVTAAFPTWPYRLISYPFKMKKYALYSS
ncbi:hypothetical protein L249_2567, partial [Ophiocordyceps polyrhachis-furcata BCC 54312]